MHGSHPRRAQQPLKPATDEPHASHPKRPTASTPSLRTTGQKRSLFMLPHRPLPPSYSFLGLYLQLRRNPSACAPCLWFLSFTCTYWWLDCWFVVLCKRSEERRVGKECVS